MDTRPTVWHPFELADLLQYVLNRRREPQRLIVCSSQDDFISQLRASIEHAQETALMDAAAAGADEQRLKRLGSRKHDLLIPTLHQLARASNISVTFCSTLAQLQAYLSTYHLDERGLLQRGEDDSDEKAHTHPAVTLINPVALHRNMASFSAQGLSRTFASAVEAAERARARLYIVECPSRAANVEPVVGIASEHGPGSSLADVNADSDDRHPDDLWEEQVSIMNVSTKSFGPGERGWVGRTVPLRHIVERWCVFERPDI